MYPLLIFIFLTGSRQVAGPDETLHRHLQTPPPRAVTAIAETSDSGSDVEPIEWPWEASVKYDYDYFSSNKTSWTDWYWYEAKIRRKWEPLSISLAAFRTRRFNRWDSGAVLDSYFDLWRRSYGNFRLQTAFNASVLPDLDYIWEVYQGVGSGWETSVGYRIMDFSHKNVHLFMASIAKYKGNWYLRDRITMSRKDAGWSVSHNLMARRYLSTADDYWEISGSSGRSPVTLGSGGRVEIRSNWSLNYRVVRRITDSYGISLSVNYNDRENLPIRRGVTVTLSRRW